MIHQEEMGDDLFKLQNPIGLWREIQIFHGLNMGELSSGIDWYIAIEHGPVEIVRFSIGITW